MRVVLDAGLLARAIGEGGTGLTSPGELSTVVVATLDVSPYLISVPAESPSQDNFLLTGNGRWRSIAIANPAVGADYNIIVPGGVAWHLRAFIARYTAGAAAATRLPRLLLRDNGDFSLMLLPGIASILATQAVDITWAQGINSRQSTGGLLEFGNDVPADFIAGPGWRFRTVTGNIQAADQWSSGRLFVREYSV